MKSLQKQLSAAYHEYLSGPQLHSALMAKSASFQAFSNEGMIRANSTAILAESAGKELVKQYSVQQALRPFFGKGAPKKPDCGDHPDFRHLRGTTDQEYCGIGTLVMDIRGSTRLNLYYPPDKVHRIKNSFMQATVEIASAFDGHIHRFMGDSVMTFFGGKNVKAENAIIDSLNCAAVLLYFVDKVVNPSLEAEGYERKLGIRLGLDYGDDKKVLWASYGYPGSEEVTATGLNVDLAAKLQQSAGKNQVMIGESLRSFVDFPLDLLDIKTITKNGNEVEELYVQPNYTTRTGQPMNYKQHLLKYGEYLSTSTVGQADSDYFQGDNSPKIIPVRAEISHEKYSDFTKPYEPCSRMIPKGKWIKFIPQLPAMPMLPYTARFSVENHGDEARIGGEQNYGSHVTETVVTTRSEHERLCHWETTAYRGLHYMTVEIVSHNRLQYRTRFGVYVE